MNFSSDCFSFSSETENKVSSSRSGCEDSFGDLGPEEKVCKWTGKQQGRHATPSSLGGCRVGRVGFKSGKLGARNEGCRLSENYGRREGQES